MKSPAIIISKVKIKPDIAIKYFLLLLGRKLETYEIINIDPRLYQGVIKLISYKQSTV